MTAQFMLTRRVGCLMLIAFSGFKESGKDTAAQVLIDRGWTKVAFADALRELLLAIDPFVPMWTEGSRFKPARQYPARLSYIIGYLGWDEAKKTIPEVRQLMQRTGTEGIRNVFGPDAWINALEERFPDLFYANTRYVLTDCRFDNEADFVLDNGGFLYWIERPGRESDGHASESTAPRDMADAIIVNDGSIEGLQYKVAETLKGRGITW
jgi:hypothetical protein